MLLAIFLHAKDLLLCALTVTINNFFLLVFATDLLPFYGLFTRQHQKQQRVLIFPLPVTCGATRKLASIVYTVF
ncbi:putative membrane protein [Candidatus Ichthyocystis hellenicum]|uniref:Putative membrane protein n=1 Tax=Candidatus Ichthyocystis hellenicum TaxID=1561003 RepID=A0A0S4M0B8_9BURK|nr:putative membrane protein [Candidatus Ichthyocystis hellenicum]